MRLKLLPVLLIGAWLPAILYAENGRPVSLGRFSETVRFVVPDDFTLAFQDENSRSFIAEFIPDTEVIDNWSEIISLQINLLDHAATTSEIMQFWVNSMATHCDRETFSAGYVLPPQQLGAAELEAVFVACGTVVEATPKRSEIVTAYFVVTEKSLITLQWAKKGERLDNTLSPDGAYGRAIRLLPLSINGAEVKRE